MPAPRRSRSTLIVLLLVATLAMTATLAYEAQQAARSHRATAENVLRDYSKFAAWELTRLGRQGLLNAMNAQLSDVQTGIRGGNLGASTASAPVCRSGCGQARGIATTFSASLPDARFTFAGAPVDNGVHELLAAVAADGLRRPADFTCPAMKVTMVNGQPAVVVWRPLHDASERPSRVIGFITDVSFVSRAFEQILRQTPLLPPTLVPAGANPNATLAVRVATPEGLELFSSAPDGSLYGATEKLAREFSDLQLAVALRPDAAEGLIIGGLPRERLPLVIGLLTLTVGLVVVALVQLRREAELSRMRSEFVSGVSHELRTPLAQIRMFTETLLLGRVRSANEGRRSLEIIARETQRLIQLVENVLLFSRGERRRPEIAREDARLAPIVSDVIEGFAPLAGARQARIITRLDDTIVASVDAGAVRQILLNLLDNAVKYGPAKQTITVTVQHDDGRARITVEDEGPGVAAADAERIWQPFNRLAQVDTASGGAGIGLAIVRQLSQLHGGRAWVERGSAGARFVVELPGARSEARAISAVA